jgi:Heterokaryon incompatibility protein (HET)
MKSTNNHPRRRLPSASTLSKSNLELVNHWISDCKASHSKCHLEKTTWTPTRLLDVGPPDGSKNPRLIEAAGKGVRGPYTALSHMWGDPSKLPPLRTTISNYEDMKCGIKMCFLSKNFADTVIVTRQLGMRYVWIDSLCIVQDSPEDWRKEAAMMHQVYRYAEVTIVAYDLLLVQTISEICLSFSQYVYHFFSRRLS